MPVRVGDKIQQIGSGTYKLLDVEDLDETTTALEKQANKDAASGYAGLDASSQVTKSILFNSAPGADLTGSGDVATFTAGANHSPGAFCYIGADTKMEPCDANAEATSRCVAICLDTIAENSTGRFLLRGFFRRDAWNWTAGGFVYLSETPGLVTQTAPSGVDCAIVVVGVALTADILYFSPQLVIVEHV